MRRIVAALVAFEVIAILVLAISSRSENTDAAGRGLAVAYLLVLGAPVLLATIAWFAGYWKLAGALALILPAMVAYMLLKGPSKEKPEEVTDWFGDPRVTALLAALASPDKTALTPFNGQKDVLNAFSTDSSRTVLTFAARQFPGSVGTLVELGADPNLVPPHGLHPVIAAFDEPPMVLRQLLMNGANPNAQLRPGEPALQHALWQRKPQHARLLIEGGADLHTVDNLGRTALYAAVENYHFDLAILLLQKGSDPAAKARDGSSVQSLLEQPSWMAWHDANGFAELVAALRSRGIDIKLPAVR